MSKLSPEGILWGMNFRRRRKGEVSRLAFLKTIPFFDGLSQKQLEIVGHQLHERRYEENEFLFEVNHPGAALFIIMGGEVVVQSGRDSGPDHILATIKPGEFLGELALLDHSPRSASARATKPTIALALFRTELNQLAKSHPDIACEIFRNLACIVGERLKATNRVINHSAGKAA